MISDTDSVLAETRRMLMSIHAEAEDAAGQVQRVVMLRIRSLIADKEMVTAQANLDLARSGEWRCDYAAWHGQIDAEIKELLKQHNGPS